LAKNDAPRRFRLPDQAGETARPRPENGCDFVAGGISGWPKAKIAFPRLGDIMSSIQARHIKLWYAGTDRQKRGREGMTVS